MNIERSQVKKKRLPFGCLLVILVCFGSVLFYFRLPSAEELENGCRTTLQETPRAEALQMWLIKKKVPFRVSEAKDLEDVLVFNGISHADVQRSSSCIHFENVELRGGLIADHFAYGYFLFSPDGGLITYKIFDAYQFL